MQSIKRSLLFSKSRLQVSHSRGQPGATARNSVHSLKRSRCPQKIRCIIRISTWITFWRVILRIKVSKILWIRAASCSQLTARLASITSARHRKCRISRWLLRRAGARHRWVESVRWAVRNIANGPRQSTNYVSRTHNSPTNRISQHRFSKSMD